MKKTAKRATRTSGRHSKKDELANDSTPRDPHAPPPAHDEKKFLGREREVFKLYDINLEVPRGQLCAIVGPVGAGKSSLVQGMIGGMALRLEIARLTYETTAEMRKTGGKVTFGGSVAYCAQAAWIRVRVLLRVSATNDLRESHRVPLSVITFCLAHRSMRSAINPQFATVACSKISRSSREFVVNLSRL